MSNKIKQIVQKLVEKHGTNNPYEIASRKSIVLMVEPLGKIYGYYHTFKRIKIIHINDDLDEPMKRFVCAHELGHAVLHPEISTSSLRKNTLFSMNKIEKEANQFAVELLMPDSLIYENWYRCTTVYEAAAIYDVPREMAELKKIERS